MKTHLRTTTYILLIIGIFMLTDDVLAHDRILVIKDKKVIDFNQILQNVKDKQIILVGESHDNPEHHKYQLQVIKALYEANMPVAIGLEMFKAESQGALDNWVSGRLSQQEFLSSYYTNWNIPWPLYKDIFLFARDNKIPMIGLNVPEEITRKVVKKGFSALTDEEVKELPPGISCDVDATYMEFIKGVYSAHHPGKEFISFCEAQMVWDSAMALHTLKFLEKNPGYTVVILAGMVHSWKRAIPERIKRLNGQYNVSVILPETPDRVERNKITADDADFLILK